MITLPVLLLSFGCFRDEVFSLVSHLLLHIRGQPDELLPDAGREVAHIVGTVVVLEPGPPDIVNIRRRQKYIRRGFT